MADAFKDCFKRPATHDPKAAHLRLSMLLLHALQGQDVQELPDHRGRGLSCRVGSEVVLLEKRLWEIKRSTDDDCLLGGMCDAKATAKTETW